MSPKLPLRLRPPSVTRMAPLRFAAASLSTNSDRLATSSIVPTASQGDRPLEPDAALAGEEAASPLGVADRPGGDRVDADAPGAPLDGQGAGQRVDGRLRRRDVQLAGGPAVVQGGADVEDLSAVVAHPGEVGGPRGVPGPLGVDVEDRAEPVRREVGRRAEEVARGGVDQDVEPSQLLQTRATAASTCVG